MKRAACLFLALWTAGFWAAPIAASAENAPLNLGPNPKTAGAAAKNTPAPPPPPPPIDPATAIQKANAYFSSNATMIGDFVQIGGDGRRSEGKIYVQRPGKLRFEYALPATLEIVADGMSVAVVDRKLGTKDVYFINQTPLKFLLKDQIDLSRDAQVVSVTSDPNVVSILIEDKSTFGGTSFIKLMFDPVKFTLKQWQITDPQGYETLVSLFNVDLTKKPDPWLFGLAPPPAEHPVNAN
ncbi:outer-membrane lipoprotein carrier protein LolA [Methyloferula stellata]|uniref:outer-membrane lipoprotein carrier protein LolA n=1 Tax=Methyloferula stellata TaxID=876270 RepID=UPI001FCCBAEE|nr:outer-membrane lipoprotein carrier protein LolA [Methyloferula stellata]